MSVSLDQIEAGLAMALEGIRKARIENDWVDQAKSPLGRRMHLSLVRRGLLPGHKIGKRVLVRRADIDEYVLSHRTAAAIRAAVDRDERDEVAAILATVGTKAKRARRGAA